MSIRTRSDSTTPAVTPGELCLLRVNARANHITYLHPGIWWRMIVAVFIGVLAYNFVSSIVNLILFTAFGIGGS